MKGLSDKLNAVLFGRAGEQAAALFLRAKGYRIVARNMRGPGGEIDLIVRKNKLLCFVEVKSRRNLDCALHSLTAQQKKRYLRSAQSYLFLHPEYANFQLRFDLIAISAGRWPIHIQNAWWEET